jgi:hypothetical protein
VRGLTREAFEESSAARGAMVEALQGVVMSAAPGITLRDVVVLLGDVAADGDGRGSGSGGGGGGGEDDDVRVACQVEPSGRVVWLACALRGVAWPTWR